MNDWQMAQQILGPIRELRYRTPMNVTTGRVAHPKPNSDTQPTVTEKEMRMFATLRADGWSAQDIAEATGRHERTVRRHWGTIAPQDCEE